MSKKFVEKEALAKTMALQKEYIDKGDKANAEAIAKANQAINVLAGYNSVVGDFPYGTTDYLANDVWGDPKHLLRLWWPVLIDTTDNADTTTAARKLRRNNLLRFESGAFAPVVAITQAMYNECMANAIFVLDGDNYTQVYAAGAFNAEAQWETDKALIKAGEAPQTLYKQDGSNYVAVSHVLRPWETTETKYTMGVANRVDLYLLDQQTGTSGKNLKGIFLNANPYDGIEISKWRLPPTAISPCPITTIQDGSLIKARNFFYLYQGITNCRSDKGLLPTNPTHEADRTYPRTNDIHQVNNMKYARNNNADASRPYPFAEGGHFAWNVFITALELAAKTRYIHAASLFGSGISSNDGCKAANFFTSGGIRLKTEGAVDWSYKTFGANSAPLQFNANGATTEMSNVLTQDGPKEQCMESQLAASMATELGIAPSIAGEEPNYFEFYGNKYYYMNVPDFEGLQDGAMNVRVYKYIKGTLPAWANKVATNFDIEIILRMSLFNGVNLCGDIWAYNGGGLEMVGTPKAGATVGNTIKIYVEPDQLKWHNEQAITKPAGTRFAFEDAYQLVLETTNLGDSYTLTRGGYTPWKIAKASAMAQGECYYQWDNARWISGTNHVRVESLFRVRSYYASCSPRNLNALDDASNTSRNRSGSAQTLVRFV